MEFTDFGNKLTERSGILELMDDLGRPLKDGIKPYPLGGGNPARIAEVEELYEKRLYQMLESSEILSVIASYDAPQGRMGFIKDLAAYFNNNFADSIRKKNLPVLRQVFSFNDRLIICCKFKFAEQVFQCFDIFFCCICHI